MGTKDNFTHPEGPLRSEIQKQALKQLITIHADRSHDLTIEEIKQMESFKNMKDDDVNELIAIIKKFTSIVFGCENKKQNKALVITLNNEHTKNEAA